MRLFGYIVPFFLLKNDFSKEFEFNSLDEFSELAAAGYPKF